MTIAVQLETSIARPAAEVYAHLIDIERFPEWLIASGIVGVERLDDDPRGPGSSVRISQRVAGRSTVLDGSITRLEPDRAIGLHGRDPDGITIDIEATLLPDTAGCRLRWSLELGLPLRFRMFESMVAPQVRRAVALDLEAFRRRVEDGSPD